MIKYAKIDLLFWLVYNSLIQKEYRMANKIIEYQTYGTCCQLMIVEIDENNKIQNSEFFGGCNGNLQGIKSLIQGMDIDEVIEKLKGISCNGKPTSCPDQLAICLMHYKDELSKVEV